MRMWMLPPRGLCRKHLLGEHVELHMLAATLTRNKNITGFVTNRLVQPADIVHRHEKLAEEMLRRGYTHHSPLDPQALIQALSLYPSVVREATVDINNNRKELARRCAECHALLACCCQ